MVEAPKKDEVQQAPEIEAVDNVDDAAVEEEDEKEAVTKSKKKKKKKKATDGFVGGSSGVSTGVRIRRNKLRRANHDMTADVGELAVIDTRGGKVVTVTHGDVSKGKPYLCLHGWGHDSYSRDIQWQFEALRQLGYFVICPDMPGFGRSDGDRHCARSSTNFDAGGPVEIVEDVLKHFGLLGKKISVYGYSWGGGIALSLALSSSIRMNISKLVLFHPSYTEQKRGELAGVVCSKIILLWTPIDLIHPVALGRYFHKVLPQHEYHEVDCGKYVKGDAGKHEWEKHCDKFLPLITRFMK